MPFRLTDPVVDVDGVRLECRWIGPPPDRAPTVVMLHEGLGPSRSGRIFRRGSPT